MAKKIKKYKVGMNSETYAISLVESPAIEEDFIALSKEEEKVEIKLSEDEKHIVYGAVLIPDKEIYRNNGENEFYISFSKESIEKMSQDFMKEYRQYEVKTDHDKIADEVCVVESWIKTDLFKDKSVALGLNETLPIGTWFAGMKVNNIETWDRIKSGELKGFSVESMISLEEFSKNDNNMIETNDEMFFDKIKSVFKEVLSSISLTKQEDQIEPIEPEALEAQEPIVETPSEPTVEAPAEPQPTEAPKAEETVVEEPKVEEPKPQEEQVVEEPKPQEVPNDNHLEDLIKSLKDEVEALKKMNSSLNSKVKTLEKTHSAQPVNVNAKPSGGVGVESSTYQAWREQMRQMY